LTHQRKLVHTPKDGTLHAEDDAYYMERIKQNEFLRNFMEEY